MRDYALEKGLGKLAIRTGAGAERSSFASSVTLDFVAACTDAAVERTSKTSILVGELGCSLHGRSD